MKLKGEKMQIRRFRQEDATAVRDICFLTASGKRYQKNKDLVCTLFCDYYINFEPSNCFVLTAENDLPVGYVLCAQNYEQYIKTFLENYHAKVRALSKIDAFLKRHEFAIFKRVAKAYPAHLHIDILSEYQGKGWGKGLVRKLQDALKTNGVKGLHLTVDTANKRAIKFYYKLGFKKVKSLFGQAVVLAKRL